MSTTPPFSLVLPSRPVLVNPTIISPTQYAFTFPSSPSFSHLVVFLLPGASLPDDTLTGVYIQLPNSNEFKFLGAIGTEKPSAIFKVNVSSNQILNRAAGAVVEDEMTDSDAPSSSSMVGDVTLGLSIEPTANIVAQLDSLRTSQMALVSTHGQQQQQRPPNPVSTKILAQRIIKNAYNFLGSFAGSAGPGGVEVVPLKGFQDWWTKFERKVENDPGFLEREQSD